jgi:hypothetical protein
MPVVGDSVVWIPDHPDSSGAEPTEAEIHSANHFDFCMPEYPNQCTRKIVGSGTYYRSVWVNGTWREASVHITTASLKLSANPTAVKAGQSVTFMPSWSDGSTIAPNQISNWTWFPDAGGSSSSCSAGTLPCQATINASGKMRVTVSRNGVSRTATIHVTVFTEFKLTANNSIVAVGDTITFTPKLNGTTHPAARWRWVAIHDTINDTTACAAGVTNCKKHMYGSGYMWAYLSATQGVGDSAKKYVVALAPTRTCTSPVLDSNFVTTIFDAVDASHPEPHAGRDYRAQTPRPVYAADSGKVVHARSTGTSGLLVVIRSPQFNVLSYYGHLSSILVSVGQNVNAGTLIAYTGNTGGGNSTGPHLHFQQNTLGPVFVPRASGGGLVVPRYTAINPCTWENP